MKERIFLNCAPSQYQSEIKASAEWINGGLVSSIAISQLQGP